MPDVSSLPVEWQAPAAILFFVLMAIFAAWARVFGKKEGPPTPKVQEFALSGQFADMGPVKELIEGVGLLIQQQIKANMHSEATAKALTKFAELYEHRVEDEQREKEIADEVDRRIRQRTPLK